MSALVAWANMLGLAHDLEKSQQRDTGGSLSELAHLTSVALLRLVKVLGQSKLAKALLVRAVHTSGINS